MIFGFPYAMSPSPKRKHQVIERKFIVLANDALQQAQKSCACEIYHGLDWIIDDSTVVRPDAMIVCGKFDEDFLNFPPALIVEIASKGTIMKDRNIKFSLYQSQGVPYYILVHPDAQRIETYQLINNFYQEVESESFQLTPKCTINLNLQRIWL